MIENLKILTRRLIKLSLSDEQLLNYYRRKGLKIGKNCRFFSMNFGSEPYLVSIGNHVTITANVQFITHDGGAFIFRDKEPEIEATRPIKIGNNVFIGVGTIILPGTIIEDNVVIGAGAILKGTYESGFVYAGVPAKKIKSIDDYRKTLDPYIENMHTTPETRKKQYYLKKFKV